MSHTIHTAFIALGSNLQQPASQVGNGFAALADLPQSRLLACSSLYRTAPVGYDAQPDFINAAAQLETALAAEALLQALLTIETAFGRQRSFCNAPRVLDLDLLLYDDLCIETPTLTLPHPRMHQRGFVLFPLAEIAPEHYIPGQGRVIDLLQKLPPQGVEKLA